MAHMNVIKYALTLMVPTFAPAILDTRWILMGIHVLVCMQL